jgi:predicted AlkP superfamily pyrophosphatase or phosphodiesterase
MIGIVKRGIPAIVLATCMASQAYAKEPKLVLQITVDQLRGDLIALNRQHLGKGGFAWLEKKGVQYSNAHYEHANTETVVGHATLATGAQPSEHGMVANVWLDPKLGRLVYNVEDPDFNLLSVGEGVKAGVDQKSEIDPTQKAAKVDGRSPRMLMGTTFSDELTFASNGEAKVFAVSVKDRGAIMLAGHTGKAYWFSKSSGDFVTSDYYMQQYPRWVADWNNQNHPLRYANTQWSLTKPVDQYRFGASDDNDWETDLPGWGRVFPHHYGEADSKMFNTYLTLSPAGDELTVDFALELIANEKLGADAQTDYLSVSLSSTDYVGHIFGPASLEAEENILRLDNTLARLLRGVDSAVGLKNVAIVLSADHGGPEAPGYLTRKGLTLDYVDPTKWEKTAAIKMLKQRFGISESLIDQYFHPYLYLNHEVIKKNKLDPLVVQQAVAQALTQFDGVNLAISSERLFRGEFPDLPIYRSVLNNYNPKRSGDIYVVFDPNRFINDFDGLVVAASHGSPWAYDTHVPIIMVVPGVKPQTIHRRVAPASVAPTLSALLGIKPPSGSYADLLLEVLRD